MQLASIEKDPIYVPVGLRASCVVQIPSEQHLRPQDDSAGSQVSRAAYVGKKRFDISMTSSSISAKAFSMSMR